MQKFSFGIDTVGLLGRFIVGGSLQAGLTCEPNTALEVGAG